MPNSRNEIKKYLYLRTIDMKIISFLEITASLSSALSVS
jgi:hypothetical protein